MHIANPVAYDPYNIFTQARQLTEGQLELRLRGSPSNHEEAREQRKWFFDILNDPFLCGLLGIDYATLRGNLYRAAVVAIDLARRYAPLQHR